MLLTIFLYDYIPISSHPLEGVVMRRHASGVGCGACGRGRTYPRSREAPGPDRGVLWPLREELAGLGPFHMVSDGPRRDKPMRRTGAETQAKKPEGNQETRTRGSEIAAVERREAPAFSKRERGKTEDWCAALCSTPSGLARGKKKAPRMGQGRRPTRGRKEYGR